MEEGGRPVHMVMERQGVPLSGCTGFPVREEGKPSAGCVLSGFNETA
jgi:hypothetical protein